MVHHDVPTGKIHRVYEVGYGPTFEVLDHSELYLDCVPGTPPFSQLEPKLKGKLTPDQIHELKQMTELFGRLEEWIGQAEATGDYQVRAVDFTIKWRRLARRAGIFSVLASGRIASVSLLICTTDDMDANEQAAHESSMIAFVAAIEKANAAEPGSYDHRHIPLVTMTRRPLLASMFWPPYTPMDHSVVRTIQLQMAYAFFRLHREI